MAENNLFHGKMGQLDSTYRELLVKLKAYVTQLDSQTDAMLCIKWIQKLQGFTEPTDIRLRNYLLLQICNQIRTGYLDHPFINLGYLDQDLIVVANCCRELDAMYNTTDDAFEIRLERSISNMTDTPSNIYISDIDGAMTNEVIKSLAKQTILKNKNSSREEPNKPLMNVFENAFKSQNFYQRKYEETLDNLKEAKIKLYLKNTRSVEEFVENLSTAFIDKYQHGVDELLSMEKSPNLRQEFLVFRFNFTSKFKSSCGDFLNVNTIENLLRAEDQFQRIFYRILSNCIDSNECKKDAISTGRGTESTDLDVTALNNIKYTEYMKRYIRKQQKQFNRKIQDYETQIVALKNEICLRDKKQSMEIIELKCENIIKNEQRNRDQLSESINDLEIKYKNIVQQIFDEIQEKT